MLITLKEYCERNGKDIRTARTKASNGDFNSAVKMGRDWLIDEDEPYVDKRFKTGKWVGYVRKRNRPEE